MALLGSHVCLSLSSLKYKNIQTHSYYVQKQEESRYHEMEAIHATDTGVEEFN